MIIFGFQHNGNERAHKLHNMCIYDVLLLVFSYYSALTIYSSPTVLTQPVTKIKNKLMVVTCSASYINVPIKSASLRSVKVSILVREQKI